MTAPKPLERLDVVAREGVREADRPAIDAQRGNGKCADVPRRRAHGVLAILGDNAVPPADVEREPPIGVLRVGVGIAGHRPTPRNFAEAARSSTTGTAASDVRNTRPPKGTVSDIALAIASGAEPSCSW